MVEEPSTIRYTVRQSFLRGFLRDAFTLTLIAKVDGVTSAPLSRILRIEKTGSREHRHLPMRGGGGVSAPGPGPVAGRYTGHAWTDQRTPSCCFPTSGRRHENYDAAGRSRM